MSNNASNGGQKPTRTTKSDEPKSLSRRSLLRVSATAMPVVLTLQSGEALARSSNLIAEAPPGTTVAGKTYCLDTSTATPLGAKYDLHDPGYATVNKIADADYYPVDAGRSVDPITSDAFCNAGGTMQHHDGGWHTVELPANGIVVSNDSLISVSSRVDFFYRDWL